LCVLSPLKKTEMEKLLEARVIEFQKLLVVTNCSFLCANDKKKSFKEVKETGN
jgi:hypothetical protein